MTVTIIIRTLTLPITIMQLRNAANMNNNMPTLMKFQQQMLEAQKNRDQGRGMYMYDIVCYIRDMFM